MTEKGCTKTNCSYYHLINEEIEPISKKESGTDKNNRVNIDKEMRLTNEMQIKGDSKNELKLSVEAEKFIQTQLLKILLEQGLQQRII